MSNSHAYRIVDSGTRGMIAVVDRNIKAGELVVEEKEPLLFFTKQDREHYKNEDPSIELALTGYDIFKRLLTDEQRQKLLTLYGPVTGFLADYVRKVLTENGKTRDGPDEEYRSLSPLEIEKMVKNSSGDETEHVWCGGSGSQSVC